MVETPEEDYESFDSAEDLFASFEEEDLKWEKEHPFRAYIRNWLDKRFPSGIAGGCRVYYASPWKILRYYKDEIRYAYQRVFRGFDDKASWHIGYYLAKTLPKIIRQLKEEGHGVPMSMYDIKNGFSFPEKQLGSIDENGDYIETEGDKAASEKWNKILDEIADGFDSYIKYDEKFLLPEKYAEDEDYQKFQRALDLLKTYFEDLWD